MYNLTNVFSFYNMIILKLKSIILNKCWFCLDICNIVIMSCPGLNCPLKTINILEFELESEIFQCLIHLNNNQFILHLDFVVRIILYPGPATLSSILFSPVNHSNCLSEWNTIVLLLLSRRSLAGFHILTKKNI